MPPDVADLGGPGHGVHDEVGSVEKNQINLGTGWPDFATVVSHPYSSAVSLLEISCVSSAVIAPNVVSEYDP